MQTFLRFAPVNKMKSSSALLSSSASSARIRAVHTQPERTAASEQYFISIFNWIEYGIFHDEDESSSGPFEEDLEHSLSGFDFDFEKACSTNFLIFCLKRNIIVLHPNCVA